MTQNKKIFNSLSGSSVLVTGGNGAVGTHLVKKLAELNCQIVVLDNFSQSKKGNLSSNKKLKIINGNINEEKILRKTFETKYDYVFHLAARFANEMSVMNPILDLDVNVKGTLQILLHSAKQKIERFVYSSSSSLYGSQSAKNFLETLKPNPSTPYAASKLSGEFYCNAINELYGIDYTILRLSNSYGPFDPPGRFRNVIPNFFVAAMKNNPLIITGTGNETRDFTFVEDTVSGILLASVKSKAQNEIFNLGTGKDTKISELAKSIIKITNSKSKIIFKPSRNFDHIKRRKMNIDKAKTILGYSPQTSLIDGLKITYSWLQNQVI